MDEFERLLQLRLLRSDDRVELLEGDIYHMSPIGSAHAACVKRLNGLFMPHQLEKRLIIGVQDPVRLDEYSVPLPDISLLAFRDDFYQSGHPRPDDVFLLAEVCETSYEYDREIKVPLYAGAGIREVWLIELGDRRLTVFRGPEPGAYTEVREASPDGFMDLTACPGIQIPVRSIFG